jgi:hypothetical protein
VIALFDQTRQEDYAAIEARLKELEAGVQGHGAAQAVQELKGQLDRLQDRYADVARIDYFASPPKAELAARLARLRQALLAETSTQTQIARTQVDAYRGKRWVTRPRPHVDRLACAWLIRRYVDAQAAIRYGSDPEPDEVPFDLPGAAFGHQGELCSLEVIARAFDLQDSALLKIAEIVHEIDLRDGLYAHSETGGVDALLRGWQLAELPDDEMEARGLALFDGLYAAFSGGFFYPGRADK